MTIAHLPGSIDLLIQVAGTLPSNRLGTFGAGKTYGGTFGRSVVTPLVGSFGTHASRLVRANVGSIRGTISAHRLSVAAFPGTWLRRTTGTFHTWIAAPPQPRWVSISLRPNPNVTFQAIAVLRQSNGGTIGYSGLATTATEGRGAEITGWVLPKRGSYVLGSDASGLTSTVKSWMEWDP